MNEIDWLNRSITPSQRNRVTPPDRYRCFVKQKARVLCGPCKRDLGGYVIPIRAETNAPCDSCGAGGTQLRLGL
jgi:hypothetical protein